MQLHVFVYTFCNQNFYYFCHSFSHLNSYFSFSYSDDACENLLSVFSSARACLKKAFRELRVPVCGRFYPNEGGVAGYGNRIRVKYTAKWGLQIAEMIFQTRSSTSFLHFYIKTANMLRGILLYRAAAYCKIKIGPLDDY